MNLTHRITIYGQTREVEFNETDVNGGLISKNFCIYVKTPTGKTKQIQKLRIMVNADGSFKAIKSVQYLNRQAIIAGWAE